MKLGFFFFDPMEKWFAGKRPRWLIGLTVLWIAFLTVPYGIIGETWGSVWYLLTLPISEWYKDLWESSGVVTYVSVVTVIHGGLVFILLSGGANLFDRLRGKPTNGDAGSNRTQTDMVAGA